MDDLEIGKSIKVHLPGESPWADIVGLGVDGSVLARIANKLLPEWTAEDRERAARANNCPSEYFESGRHPFKEGDILRFHKVRLSEYGDTRIWVPSTSVKDYPHG